MCISDPLEPAGPVSPMPPGPSNRLILVVLLRSASVAISPLARRALAVNSAAYSIETSFGAFADQESYGIPSQRSLASASEFLRRCNET